MNKTILYLFFFLLFNYVNGQNLINNHDFFDNDQDYDVNATGALNFKDNIDEWEGLTVIVKPTNPNPTYYHSPDWINLYTHKYIRMSDYELIQQSLEEEIKRLK